MRVELEIDPRNDAGRDRHALAADGIAVGGDGRFQFRNTAETHRRCPFEKIGRCHFDQRQVAIVRDEKHAGRVFLRIAVALHGEVATVADDMGIRHDAPAVDDEPSADSALDGAGVPRCLVVWFYFGAGDPDDAVLDFAVRLRGEIGGEEKGRTEQKMAAVHAQEVREDETVGREIKSRPDREASAGLFLLRRPRGRGRERLENGAGNRR